MDKNNQFQKALVRIILLMMFGIVAMSVLMTVLLNYQTLENNRALLLMNRSAGIAARLTVLAEQDIPEYFGESAPEAIGQEISKTIAALRQSLEETEAASENDAYAEEYDALFLEIDAIIDLSQQIVDTPFEPQLLFDVYRVQHRVIALNNNLNELMIKMDMQSMISIETYQKQFWRSWALFAASAVVILIIGGLFARRIAKHAFAKVSTEISERIVTEGKLEYLANYDQLTGLANRRFFVEKLEEIIKQPYINDKIVLMFIDIDAFKQINDQYGHRCGDFVLIQSAIKLSQNTRSEDLVTRMGGDEFSIVFKKIKDVETIRHVCERILSDFKQEIKFKEETIKISVSIGVSIFGLDAEDMDSLVNTADDAMYQAKKQGKDQYCLYSEMNQG